MEYHELLSRVVQIERELSVLRAENIPRDELLGRINSLELELRGIKRELVAFDDSIVNNPMRGSPILDPVAATRESIMRERAGLGGQGRKDMEFKVGKTVMSVLASVLILGSIVLFGALLYPFLSDGMKVVIMYTVSLVLTGIGLFGRRKGKFTTFFTAIAGCGISALYISSVLSCLFFNAFGVGVLGVLIYAWVLAVAWISRERVPVFAYICYIGILIATGLCFVRFGDVPVCVVCYIVCLTTLYLFNRTKSYGRDSLYFMQFTVVSACLMFLYMESPFVIMWLMFLSTVVYAVQRYIYRELTERYRGCLVLTELVLIYGYYLICQYMSSWNFLNVSYVVLTGFLGVWSYLAFEDRFLRLLPMCVTSLVWPLLQWGSFYTDYVGYVPFVALILLVGYTCKSPFMNGVACCYMLLYTLDRPAFIGDSIFYLLLILALVEFGILHWTRSFDVHSDRIGFMLCSCAVLTVICNSQVSALLIIGYLLAVLMSYAFNSDFCVYDDLTMRIGLMWNGYWMAYGSGWILNGNLDGVTLAIFFILVLASFMINGGWQLDSERPTISLWLCIKSTAYIWMLLSCLSDSGVVISIGFLLFAICCIVLGSFVQRKVIRLYGLTLAILSVLKCVIFDIQYSSSLYRPVGLLVAGLLCFGISWIYTVVERRFREGSSEE